MTTQLSIFGAGNLASTVQVPTAPELVPHYNQPYPDMSPVASAQASMARSHEYFEMLAAVINAQGGGRLTSKQVLAMVPVEWRDLCGKFAHATLPNWTASAHGIEITYVPHDDGGFHFDFMAKGGAA